MCYSVVLCKLFILLVSMYSVFMLLVYYLLALSDNLKRFKRADIVASLFCNIQIIILYDADGIVVFKCLLKYLVLVIHLWHLVRK